MADDRDERREPDRRDRGQVTLKGREISPEFLNMVRKAAILRKKTMVAYIVEHMTEKALEDIKGSRGEATSANHPPPARLEDVNAGLLALIQKLDEREVRRDEREDRLSDRLDRLEAGGTPASIPVPAGTPGGTPGDTALDRMRLRRMIRAGR